MYPIIFEGKSIGWINKKNKQQLEKILNKSFTESINIKVLLNENRFIFPLIFNSLVKLDIIKTTLDEECPVFHFDALNPKINFNQTKFFGFKKIFNVHRSLLSYFGFPAYGVHCNGWKKIKNEYFFYLGKRSKKIMKFPGLFDNLIGGGQPSNLSLYKNLEKEGWEEAGINKKTISNSKLENIVNYCHSYNNQLSPSVMFIYNLNIKKNLKLKNRDGEIESFKCLSISEIFDLIEMKRIKPNSIIPIVSFIIKKNIKVFTQNASKELKIQLNL